MHILLIKKEEDVDSLEEKSGKSAKNKQFITGSIPVPTLDLLICKILEHTRAHHHVLQHSNAIVLRLTIYKHH